MTSSASTLVLHAVSFAAREHAGQLRKDKKTPYFAHPVRVMTVLATVFGIKDPEVLAAGVLHDTIEDTTADRDDLIERFGERVAGWVALLSKDKRLPEPERERLYFDGLATAPVEVKLIKLADTYDNLVDSSGLPVGKRRKTMGKAKKLLELFEPGWPEEWQGAIEAVKGQVFTVEGGLNTE